jgi:xanthine dehydrogenase YagT iron-sulfur-binding subunit
MSDQIERDEKPEAASRFEFGKSTRRTFLSRLGMASLLATAGPAVTTLAQRAGKVEQMTASESKDAIPVTLSVNGEKHDLRIDPRTTLLDCLREHLHLTGSKKGCDHGQCGACTVHINGRRVNSCLCFAAMHDGEEITTVEGIGQPENLHAVQAAFVASDA